MELAQLKAFGIVILGVSGITTVTLADSSRSAEKPLSYSASPESAVLPEGVVRYRLPYQTVSGNTSYDKDGNKTDAPVTVSAHGGAVILEYGLCSSLSLQMRMDYRKDTVIKLADATKSAVWSSKTGGAHNQAELEAAVKAKVIAQFKAAGICTDATCSADYDSGVLKTTAAGSVIAGTTSVAAGTPYNTAVPTAAAEVSGAINAGIKANEYEGGASMGDTQVGALLNVLTSDSMFAAVGAGVRFPTGNRDLNGPEQGATRSAYEIGIRGNFDYLPVDFFMVSFENQLELPLAGTKRKVDGVEHEVSRKGMRNVGYLYFKPSLHVLHASLAAVKTNFGVTYDYDNGTLDKSLGTTTGGTRSVELSKYVGIGYSFMHGMGLPFQFDLEHEIPRSARNVLATTRTTATLKGFLKF